MRKPHKHAELIKAWADGAEIETRWSDAQAWIPVNNPKWSKDDEYRIKPEQKPDYVYFAAFDTVDGQKELNSNITSWKSRFDSLKLTFDGETGKLKAAEVL